MESNSPEVGTWPPEAPPESPEPLPDTPPRPEVEETELDATTAFLEGLGDMDGEGVVEVTRRTKTGHAERLENFPLESFDWQDVKAKYGGGRYTFRVKDENNRYGGQKTFRIGGESFYPDPEVAKPTEEMTAVELLSEMKTRLDGLAVEIRRGPPQGAGPSSFDMGVNLFQAFMSAQAPLLAAVMEKGKGGAGPTEMMELFFKGFELAKDLNPPADPLAAVAANVAGPLVGLLQGAAAKEQGVTMNPNPPAPAPDRPATVPTWDFLLSQYMDDLTLWAAQNKNPAVMASFVLEMAPGPAVEMIVQQVGRGKEFRVEFFALHPEARAHESWFKAFWKAVENSFEWEDSEAEPETDPTPGLEIVATGGETEAEAEAGEGPAK